MGETSEHREEFKATLLTSAEGRLLLVGVGVALVYSVWLGAKMLFEPEGSQVLVGMTATQVMFGRVAGMAFGYSMKLGHWVVIPICMVIETVQVLVIYPLFIFVWFPFWMTGPVVGCVIGFMLGLRLWVNMTVVLGGSFAAILVWAFLLGQLHEQVASYSSYAAMVLIILMVMIVALGYLLQRGLKSPKQQDDEQ